MKTRQFAHKGKNYTITAGLPFDGNIFRDPRDERAAVYKLEVKDEQNAVVERGSMSNNVAMQVQAQTGLSAEDFLLSVGENSVRELF